MKVGLADIYIIKIEIKTIYKELYNITNITMNITWTTFPSYIIGHTTTGIPDFTNSKIAAFDMDDTLIKTKSGKTHGENENDWLIFDDSVSNKLKQYVKDNYKLVIVTNQKGISTKKTDPEMWKNKIQNIINSLQVNVTILCCTGDDHYRKPCTTLWDTYIKGYDKINSFYCGDAGSLPKRVINNIEFKKDFSDTDLKFALNLNIKFIHRDEFIFNVVPKKFDINYVKNLELYCKQTNYNFKSSDKQEIVLLCGLPASGKSHFAKNNIVPLNYCYINRDTLKTPAKCVSTTNLALKEGKSVVIDNTNVSKADRLVYIDLAKKYNVSVRCLLFTCPLELCKHNSHYRNFATDGLVQIISTIAYNIMNKKYEKPLVNEGFVSVDEIEFCFEDDVHKENYCKYYF